MRTYRYSIQDSANISAQDFRNSLKGSEDTTGLTPPIATRIPNTVFSNKRIVSCNLNLARIGTWTFWGLRPPRFQTVAFDDVEIGGSHFYYVHFSECSFMKVKCSSRWMTNFFNCLFRNTTFDSGTIMSAEFYRCVFERCVFRGTEIRDTRMKKCQFDTCELDGRYTKLSFLDCDFNASNMKAGRMDEVSFIPIPERGITLPCDVKAFFLTPAELSILSNSSLDGLPEDVQEKVKVNAEFWMKAENVLHDATVLLQDIPKKFHDRIHGEVYSIIKQGR